MGETERERKIDSISCLWELKGYEGQAKNRGLHPEEIRALHRKKLELSPKKNGARK